MKISQKLVAIALCACLYAPTQTYAYSERNILQKEFVADSLRAYLVPGQKWVKYPAYADRTGWDNLFGQNKEKVIKNGEKFLNYEWKVVKASDYLEYERSGNRKVMENPFDANNQAIVQLLFAELAEGKGRFMDQLINGVFHSCEMTSWALSAHLVRQPDGRSLPAYDYDMIDLTAGDLGNMLSWVYYFMHESFDKINPEISRRLYHELDKRIMVPYLEDDSFWWMAVNYKDGCLVYDSSDPAAERLDCRKVESRNQFVIPSGGENTIVLSEGTRVKLNAESKLIYPTRFLNRQRTVFLEGEAFFDVTPDKTRPFVVQTRLGDVKVLGTRFNVNVYPEDTVCYTTLVEGRVAVNLPSTDDRMFLAPGQQAVFSGTHAEKREVNLEEYVGWVDGVYTFRDKKLRDIMQTFERWYNIDVVYEDASLADIPYTGSVKRYESILPFLEVLQLTTDLHCRIEGRNVYLSKAQ